MSLLVRASVALLCVIPMSGIVHGAEINLVDIMQKSQMVNKVLDSTSEATFVLSNKSGQERVRKTIGVTKLQSNGEDNMRMTRFMVPADVKGTVSLLIEHASGDDDMWIYLPALKKVRRLVSSNKKDSFVGTDFSYGDVIGYKVAEWNHKLLREETQDGSSCYVIESIPRSDEVRNNTGYSKRVSWVRKDNFSAIRSEFWDEAGQPLKSMSLTGLVEVDPTRHKWQAMRMEAKNLQTGHHTTIQFENFKANQKVQDDFFTTRYMEKE